MSQGEGQRAKWRRRARRRRRIQTHLDRADGPPQARVAKVVVQRQRREALQVEVDDVVGERALVRHDDRLGEARAAGRVDLGGRAATGVSRSSREAGGTRARPETQPARRETHDEAVELDLVVLVERVRPRQAGLDRARARRAVVHELVGRRDEARLLAVGARERDRVAADGGVARGDDEDGRLDLGQQVGDGCGRVVDRDEAGRAEEGGAGGQLALLQEAAAQGSAGRLTGRSSPSGARRAG